MPSGHAESPSLNPEIVQIGSSDLVLLVGASGSGKSRFAAKHFASTEIVSSDAMRAAIADDPADQSASREAFELVHLLVRFRTARRRLTVVDATNATRKARKPLLDIARGSRTMATAIVFDLPSAVCFEHDRLRLDRHVGHETIERQAANVRESMAGFVAEGFAHVAIFDDASAIDRVALQRTP